MKRITRRQARAWLDPMRRCFAQIQSGEVDSIRGYPVTRMGSLDTYERVDWCICGFKSLIARLCPEINVQPLENVEKKLAAGVPLFADEVTAAMGTIKRCENALIRHSAKAVKDAVLTEQINIELDRMAA